MPGKFNRSYILNLRTLFFALVFAGIGTAFLVLSNAAPGTKTPLGTYTNWYSQDYPATTHNELETFLTIENDPTETVSKIGYYWASQFWGAGDGGYMGIQTNGEAGSFRGKVAIFAIWGGIWAQGQQPDWCSVINGGFDGDPNASGATCRIPLPWKTGDSYRLRLRTTADDATGRTWIAWVQNQATAQEQLIGSIKTTKRGLLQGAVGNWTEFYSPGRAECDAPYSRVVFGLPKIDGVPFIRHDNLFGADRGCSNSAFTDVANGVRQEQSIPLTTPAPLPSGGTYISDLNWTSATTGWATVQKDKNLNGGPIKINNVVYPKGIGTHANSTITYNLGGNYKRFVSYAGIDDIGSGSVTFEVWGDNTKLYDSGLFDSFSRTAQINVDVTGRQVLKLVVTDAGNGNAGEGTDWADSRLISDSPPVYVHPTLTFEAEVGGVYSSSTVVGEESSASQGGFIRFQ